MTDTRPTLGQFSIVLTIFAMLFAFAMFWPLATDNLAFKRTHATAWAMTLLATPAFYIFARTYGREPLDNWWRLFWTFGWFMAVAHFWYGLFHLHAGDAWSVFERQGIALAGTIFLLLFLWGWDVANCWFRLDWREEDILSRRPAFWVGAIAFFISTVLFNNDIQSLIVGLLMTAAILLGVLQRVDALGSWREFFDSPLPPVILCALGVGAALYGPVMMSTESLTPSATAASQAKWTIWPVLLLGGVAAALFIARAPLDEEEWGWSSWQIAGAIAYGGHIYAAFWIYFGGSFAAMYAAQGWLVAGSNWLLAILWTASALAAWTNRRAFWLHGATTLLFVISTVLSTYDRPGMVKWLGLGFAAIWIAAGVMRFIRR